MCWYNLLIINLVRYLRVKIVIKLLMYLLVNLVMYQSYEVFVGNDCHQFPDVYVDLTRYSLIL